jgi:DNA gyrase subunit A
MGILSDDACLVLGTRRGRVKRVKAQDCRSTAEASWAAIIGLAGDDDGVLFAGVGDDKAQVMFFGNSRANRFAAGDVNPQVSRTARGVAGIKIRKGDHLLGGALIGDPKAKLGMVVVSKMGYVKQVALKQFSVQGRAGQGVLLLNQTKATGPVVAVGLGKMGGAVDLLSASGKRQRLAKAPADTRAKRGARLVELDDVAEVAVF